MLDLGLLFRCGDNGECVASERVLANIDNYHAKAEIARQNGAKGGRPKKTQSVSVSVSKRKPTGLQQNKTKQNKGVGFHKENQTPLSGHSAPALEGSAEGESATPYCSKCGGVARFNVSLMTFECNECGTLSRERSEVVYR